MKLVDEQSIAHDNASCLKGSQCSEVHAFTAQSAGVGCETCPRDPQECCVALRFSR